jgi:hypothetical protein
VTAAALIFAEPTHAAMDTKLSISPQQPRVGERVTIELRPYWPYERSDGSCCRLVAADVRYPFQLQAIGPGGRAALFRPHRTTNRYVWTARYRFSVAGLWRIRITNYYYSTRCMRLVGCVYRGRQLRVRVSG